MTWRRDIDAAAPAGAFAAATWAAMRALGGKRLAARLGTSVSWLHKTSNPTARQSLALDYALAADLACAEAGHGTPHFDAYERALVAAGARPTPVAARALAAALAAAIAVLQAALDGYLPRFGSADAGRRGCAA
jgi:hypothetical protein